MADRGTLHRDKLEDFAYWAQNNGYTRENTRGICEVLRLRKICETRAIPLIFFVRREGAHVTVPKIAVPMVRRFIQESRRGARP